MSELTLNEKSNGLTDAAGFEAAGIHCDVRGHKDGRLDLALVYSERSCTAAGLFTQNDIKAAPVLYCQELLAEGGERFHGFIANSGNANACTGKRGMPDTRRMASVAEDALDLPEGSFFVCSTGRIGRVLPMFEIEGGIREAAAVKNSEPANAKNAAQAILTSDTRPKTVSASFEWEGKKVTVAGMAKGAGMIEPNMATMLAFLTTDAGISPSLLHEVLSEACNGTFNAITVDGDMSTNDTVLALANGASGVDILPSGETPILYSLFQYAVGAVCENLARKIVGDGEKITKVVEVCIQGAPDKASAEKVARAIGNSLLVKTSWFGEDPNWGRLLDAAGYARVGLVEDKLSLWYDDVPVIEKGEVLDGNLGEWKEAVKKKEFRITLDLGLGEVQWSLLATDLTAGYVNFNKSE